MRQQESSPATISQSKKDRKWTPDVLFIHSGNKLTEKDSGVGATQNRSRMEIDLSENAWIEFSSQAD